MTRIKWDKVFKSGLSKFFKGCLPQNFLSPLLNTLFQMLMAIIKNTAKWKENIVNSSHLSEELVCYWF